ncbi:MAG: DNA methylase, partial [Chitinophagaceae bacterium]|nr:DNA methylase [Chitinophagaceae bacterium]
GGQYEEIGSLYGFTLLVKTEVSENDSTTLERDNRFFIQGEGGIKYTYNNGRMATDAKTASLNFLNALEKIPGIVEQEQKKIAGLQKDLPVLQEVVNGAWKKENALAELKTELAAVDRKIQLSIKPESEGKTTDQVEGETPVSDNSETTAYVKGVHLPRGVL